MKASDKSASDEMAARGERAVLRLQKKIGLALFRYTVGERRENKRADGRMPPSSYSVYVEYESDGKGTCGFVSDFSVDKARAVAFCEQLARELVTPLSLPFIYEDSLTP